MSITARDWARAQSRAPGPKFVLVVLADAADDQGVCWPRISTVAEKVGVSTHTVQRAIQYLVKHQLVAVEPRMRSDGSSSSRPVLTRRTALSLNSDEYRFVIPTSYTLESIASDKPGAIQTVREPPLPQEAKPNVESGIPNRGGGDLPELHLPKDLLPTERKWAREMIEELSPPLDQLVLDEWAGIIAADDIRASPLGCLRALIKRALEGKFTPERG
ncbi:MAG: helix-turn-helix domain-containing protein, partial [Gammaproteobacteria bacterium]|nr:helix-turn-helix domain-containing protein [Gammaproteobacteria bacterium]